MAHKKKDWIKFTIVMIVFLIGMVFLIANHIKQLWIWIIYISVWTFTEMKIAKNIHLTWWMWVIILAIISAIDILIIAFFNA